MAGHLRRWPDSGARVGRTARVRGTHGTNTELPLAELFRPPVYRRLAGYEDPRRAGRLSQDPTFRLIGSEKIWERGAALTSRLPDKVHSADGWEELLLPEGPESSEVIRQEGFAHNF
jgi:hypothetical protein